jgi:hypothetical protein
LGRRVRSACVKTGMSKALSLCPQPPSSVVHGPSAAATACSVGVSSALSPHSLKSLSQDEQQLVVGGEDGVLALWSLHDIHQALQVRTCRVHDLPDQLVCQQACLSELAHSIMTLIVLGAGGGEH